MVCVFTDPDELSCIRSVGTQTEERSRQRGKKKVTEIVYLLN
jgi:hypothetical protein